jgi:Protein of unknown function (DUF2961)
MRYFHPFLCVLAFITTAPLFAQTINPYARLSDPLAISRLAEPDFAPIRLTFGYGSGWWGADTAEPDYNIFAQDTGAGIITHLFVTSRLPDSLTTFKLYVDGNLIRTAAMQSFYDTNDGYLQNPLDTIIGEARLCDVQIPYHNGFKLITKDLNSWYDYGWRPLPSNVNLPSGDGLNSSILLQEEAQADSIYRNPSLLWHGTTGIDSSYESLINPGVDTALLTINSSNIVKNFWLLPSYYDSTLDSVWLDIYWDGEATPSISTSLLSLFGQSYDFRDLHSLPIDFTQDSGFTMRLPMPFASSMRVAFRNNSSKPVTIQGKVSLIPQAVDRDTFGYLHAKYSQTDPTKFGIPHHVLHIKGKGKYIGLLMGIHYLQTGGTYEGDAEFTIDSSNWNSFHYEGTEDYFNGAQYFSYGDFFMPFAGTSNNLANYFRFHYLDEIDFREAFDFDFQHGNNNDSHEYYRTLALWYQRQILFWTNHDTIHAGENWEIAGAGYNPGEQINIFIDSISIGRFAANSNGIFDFIRTVPVLPLGFHTLSVNGVPSPHTIFATDIPTIQLLDEPKPLSVKTGDTLHFVGAGFVPGDSIISSIGGKSAYSQSSISTENQIAGWLIVPELADSMYFVSLYGVKSGNTASPEPIQITRTLRFECEDLWTDSTSAVFGTSEFLPLLNYLPNNFSHDAALWFRPDSLSPIATEHFFVPYADTFSIGFQYGSGTMFANYDVILDSITVAHISGYDSILYTNDSLSLGVKYLPVGEHLLAFRYTSHDPRSTDSILWADYIQLNPTDQYVDSSVPMSNADTSLNLTIYPDPAINSIMAIAAVGPLSILDPLGRSYEVKQSGNALDISSLPSGVYFVSDGRSRAKFVKE